MNIQHAIAQRRRSAHSENKKSNKNNNNKNYEQVQNEVEHTFFNMVKMRN